jgi:Ribbon-helix-helix protein, copG family
MKKTSLYIEPEVDAALTRKAEAEGISKAELIRRKLRETAEDAPRPRLVGIGTVKGAPPDVSENVDHYLAATGFGEI